MQDSRHPSEELFHGVPDLTSTIEIIGTDPFATGGSSDIWRGIQKDREVTRDVAIKVIRVGANRKVDLNGIKERISQEVIAWYSLEHKNIVPLCGLCWLQGNSRNSLPSMVYPYYEAGSCIRFLKNHPDSDRMAIISQVADALEYLHTLAPPVVHGDIKSSKILMQNDGTPMVVDVGLDRAVMEALSGLTAMFNQEEYRWIAPEIFSGVEGNPPLPTSRETDVWAFGCLCLEVLWDTISWGSAVGDITTREALMSAKPPDLPPEFASTNIGHIIRHCLLLTPRDRPSMSQLVSALRHKDLGVLHNPNCKLQAILPALVDDEPSFDWVVDLKPLQPFRSSLFGLDTIPADLSRQADATPSDFAHTLRAMNGKRDYVARGAAADVWKIARRVPGYPHHPIYHVSVSKVLRVSTGDFDGHGERVDVETSQRLHNTPSWSQFTEKFRGRVSEWVPLRHLHIVQVYGLQGNLGLDVEYCPNGCLRGFMQTEKGELTNKTDILRDVLAGLQYLHDLEPPVVHGNLNTGKLFVDAYGRTKIGEFGLAALCYHVAPLVPAINFTGFSRWMSPESFKLGPDDAYTPPTKASDIWSLGCTVLEVVSGKLPYSRYKHDVRIQRAILKGEPPGDLSEEDEKQHSKLWSIAQSCWSSDPAMRPSARTLRERLSGDLPPLPTAEETTSPPSFATRSKVAQPVEPSPQSLRDAVPLAKQGKQSTRFPKSQVRLAMPDDLGRYQEVRGDDRVLRSQATIDTRTLDPSPLWFSKIDRGVVGPQGDPPTNPERREDQKGL